MTKMAEISLNWYPIYYQNSRKTIPFGAAHTYIAHAYKGVPPPPPGGKHKPDAWWLVILFTSRNERFRQTKIKIWNNYGEENA